MENLKKMANMGSSGADNPTHMAGQNMGGMGKSKGNMGGEDKDYMDKGVETLERKMGGPGQKMAQNRDMNEKITDSARGMFEKTTGKNVPEKFSK